MPAIPPDLVTRLRDTLTKSDILDSDRTLRALFVATNLAPWRNIVPQNTTNKAERVMWLIDTLYDRTAANGDNALMLFLCVLAENTHTGDAYRDELRVLAIELMKEEINRLQAALNILIAENQQLKKQIKSLEDELRHRKEEINRLQAALEEEKQRVKALRASLENCEAEKEELRKALNILIAENQQLKEQIKSLEDELRHRKEEINRLQATLNILIAENQQLKEQIKSLEDELQHRKEEINRLQAALEKEKQRVKELLASLEECKAENGEIAGKLRRITGVAIALAAAMIMGLVAVWILWPSAQPGAPVLTGLHYEVDDYNPRLVDLRTVNTDGIPVAENHTLRLFDFTALLPEEDADFAVQVEVYANAELIGSGELQREGRAAQLQTLQIAKYPSESNQDAWQVQPEWEILDVALVLSRDGKPVNKTHTPIRLTPNGRSWFIDPPNLNFTAVFYAINDGTPMSFDLRTDTGVALGVHPGDTVTFPEIWYRANAAADTKMFVEMHYLKDGNVIPGTYQARSVSRIEDGINLFAASSPLSSTVPTDADTLLLLLVREEMTLDRLTLPLRAGLSVCRTEFQCAFGTAGNSETCTDTISLDSSRLVSRIYISMTERADGNAFGYSLWEVRAFKDDDNVALSGTAKASSSEGLIFDGCRDATCAIDDNMATRWGSDFKTHDDKPQWFEINLATPVFVDKIGLVWQTAYAKAYCVTIE